MKKALQIMSWFAIAIGAISILSGFGEVNAEEASYAFLGGLFYGGLGLMVIIYLKQENK